MRVRRDGALQETTFAELGTAAREIAGGLIALGVRPGDRVAILGSTRPEWTLADCGALCAGATVVPIYHTNSPEECRYVLAHSGRAVLICEDARAAREDRAVRAELPALEHVFTMLPVDGAPSLDDLRAAARRCPATIARRRRWRRTTPRRSSTRPGTTGPPKGCVLTHANLVATMRMYEEQLRDELEARRRDLHVPPAGPLARARRAAGRARRRGDARRSGSGDPKRLLDDIAEARPMYFPSVPRVFEKIHARALGAVEDASPRAPPGLRLGDRDGRARARGRAARRARRRRCCGPAPSVADRLVLSRVRDLFGGELRLGLTGAAPIGREVLEFFDACGVLDPRGLRHDRDVRGRDAQHAGRLSASAPSAARCPAARSRSPRTARS